MFYLLLFIFLIGYGFIVFEHVNHVDKAATALLMSSILWALFALGGDTILSLGYSSAWKEYAHELGDLADVKEFITHHALLDNLAETSSILFFLLGAMTIVDLVDRYQGFRIITNKIKSTSITKLLWIISILTFFMSAVLDNLTTTIVIITVLNKLLSKQEDRWIFASMVVVSANAGGAWSPIGDVTTIMLWIGSQLTAGHIIASVLLPSLVNVFIATALFSLLTRGQRIPPVEAVEETEIFTTPHERMFMLFIGIAALISVPIFKTITHLPPYLGMLLGLGVLWVMNDRYLRHRPHADKRRFNVSSIIRSVDLPTVMFFLGILSAVGVLQSAGHLDLMANYLDIHVKNIYVINVIIGIISSIVDNVPLVAASMGMYNIAGSGATGYMVNFVQDGSFWSFLAYCAGTGGSILIIGSAAGVAAMGLERINFMWYLKKVSLIALAGYLGGAIVFYLQNILFGL